MPRSRWGWREACVLDTLVWGTSRESLYPLGRGVTVPRAAQPVTDPVTCSPRAHTKLSGLAPRPPQSLVWAQMGQRPVFLSVVCGESQAAPGGARRPPQPQLRSGPCGFPAHRAPRLLQGGRVPRFLSRGPTDTKPSHGAWRWGRWGQWQPRPRQAGPPRGCWAPSNRRPSAGGSALGLRGQDRARGGGGRCRRAPHQTASSGSRAAPLPGLRGGRLAPAAPPIQAPCMWPLPGRWRCSPSSRRRGVFFGG